MYDMTERNQSLQPPSLPPLSVSLFFPPPVLILLLLLAGERRHAHVVLQYGYYCDNIQIVSVHLQQ